jgi:hypothetical protein
MANFQKTPNDKTTRLDTSVGRLVLMLEEKVQIDLFGGGPSGEDLVVGLNDPTIAAVSDEPIKRNGQLRTYEVQGIQSGNAMLEARKGQPSGTSGPIMISNIGKYWPNFAGEKVNTVDEATALLRAGSPLVFLCRNCTTYKYDQKGNKKEMKWPGHFMVLLGVENDEETFWISDPSLAHHKYISREELEGTDIWYIHKVTDAAAVSL